MVFSLCFRVFSCFSCLKCFIFEIFHFGLFCKNQISLTLIDNFTVIRITLCSCHTVQLLGHPQPLLDVPLTPRMASGQSANFSWCVAGVEVVRSFGAFGWVIQILHFFDFWEFPFEKFSCFTVFHMKLQNVFFGRSEF